ncbi:hypothetical protein BDP27DRAFT_1359951 [Rhodocollybia butyracea]|uniref:Uncharacterized protein n=1 Tax=Rhodocollybia butyracea TaxID=206335 RepID=A0A9P5Q3U7_9AGAR|nr:hypothetical protein BDP27DRAFT_1359951 [Rhodocollybia butyracea]
MNKLGRQPDDPRPVKNELLQIKNVLSDGKATWGAIASRKEGGDSGVGVVQWAPRQRYRMVYYQKFKKHQQNICVSRSRRGCRGVHSSDHTGTHSARGLLFEREPDNGPFQPTHISLTWEPKKVKKTDTAISGAYQKEMMSFATGFGVNRIDSPWWKRQEEWNREEQSKR